MSIDNKRKTLTLGGIGNVDIKKNIETIAKNRIFNEGAKSNKISDETNAKDFLRKSTFSSFNVVKDRQIKNLNTRSFKSSSVKPTFDNKTNESNQITPENNVKDEVVQKNETTQDSKQTGKIDTHKILSSFVQKQKEEERIKREEEKVKRELENKRRQEEELRKFNAKGKSNQPQIEEKSPEVKKDFQKKENNEQKSFTNNNSNQKNTFKKDNYKKSYNKNFDEEEEGNNKKAFKTDNYSKNKNIHTYIAGDEDEEGGFGRRKRRSSGFFKNKDKSEATEHQKIAQEIDLPEFITVSDLAEKMNEKRADVVKKLISMGMPVTVNQTIDADTAELVVVEFGHAVKKRTTEHDIENKLSENQEGTEFVSRAPVVTIMGHVDHGKTSLLDSIRATHVAEGESGGITQHIGASRVEVANGKFITFIDTPGHEAFTEMRMRGANITDIVVLVVAADDGVQDQTIEAINHAKAAKAPIILAINKIDKPDANPMRVKQELLQYDVVTEDFGGEVMAVEVSAKQKLNLDKLKEAILLQAEMMDLKAPIDVRSAGAVIEARVDQNRGVIASLLVQKGILKVGDLVLAGKSYGKIKRMVDDKHKVQKEAYPSMAVEVLGFDFVPAAGDQFYVVNEDREAREIIAYRTRKELEAKVAKRSVKSLDSMLKTVGGKSAKLLPIIIKADVTGSIEAIIGTLVKLNTNEVEIDVIHSATGAVNESDINLASVSNALIVGFNVRANNNAVEMAKIKDIDIRYYSIIYNIVDDMKNILSGMLTPIKKEEISGHAEVRSVFKITGAGKVAGCFVTDGELKRSDKLRIIRDGIVIYTGEFKALKRFKDDVKEVKTGYECGISVENYEDVKEKDVIESFRITEEKREL
ncbi:MAG TPA: translation initiation factor IF-2 [Rickettsiales bacterium]|nr:translation initiation factor IF-2 [Rickettsiales bacterium]